MFGIGFPELLVILVVCLLIFGPGKIPEIGEALGKSLRDFQRAFKQPPEDETASLPPPDEMTKKSDDKTNGKTSS
jgi:sec-independent protein translocase protein TatA